MSIEREWMNLFRLKSKGEKSVQDLIQIKGLDDGKFITDDDRILQIIKVGAVNTQLMSQYELNHLLQRYEALFKSFRFHVHQEIISQPLDLKQYIQSHEEIFETTKDFKRRNYLKSYIEYTEGLQSSRKIIMRRRYIIIDEKIKGPSMKNYQNAVSNLEKKTKQVVNGLEGLELPCEKVDEPEIIKLFHIFFNYDKALIEEVKPEKINEITLGEIKTTQVKRIPLEKSKVVGIDEFK